LPSHGILKTHINNRIIIIEKYFKKSGKSTPEIRITPDFLSTARGLQKKHSESGSKQIAFGTLISVIIRGKLNKGIRRYLRKYLFQKLITPCPKKPNPS